MPHEDERIKLSTKSCISLHMYRLERENKESYKDIEKNIMKHEKT
jgi:hypothetical protein